jgi:hypothetical protein
MSFSYDSSDEERDIQEEEDMAMLCALRANKRPKHGGYVKKKPFDCVVIN